MNEMPNQMIDIQHMNVIYPGGHQALQDINLQLDSGRICGLVGINGAGKSTLFKSMMGFVNPVSGTIRIGGYNVRKALKENIVSYVPQNEDVDWNFPVLVEDVVMMGRYGKMGFMRIASADDKRAVDNALERVNMSEYRKRQIGELSGGQRKRVFVARALAQDSKIMFLDEPFTGVDAKTENALVALLKTLADENYLIVAATHNLNAVPQFCDDVILINRTIMAYGPVETTYTPDNMMKAFGAQVFFGDSKGTISESSIKQKQTQ